MSTVKLAWAIIAGSPRPIADFAGLSIGQRPQAFCPECGGEVVFKMGEYVAHHFAHKMSAPGCSAAQGEGALHWNAKFLLASIIEKNGGLTVGLMCGRCSKGVEDIPLYPVTEAPTEHPYGGCFRADIGLLRGGPLFATLEILVSHRCPPEKILYHETSRVPCFEIRAEDVTRWDTVSPLTAVVGYGYTRKPCDVCAREKQKQKEWAEQEKKEREARRRIFKGGLILETRNATGRVYNRPTGSYHVIEVAASREVIHVHRAYYYKNEGRWFPAHTTLKGFIRQEPDHPGEPLSKASEYLRLLNLPEFDGLPIEQSFNQSREEFLGRKGELFGFPYHLAAC